MGRIRVGGLISSNSKKKQKNIWKCLNFIEKRAILTTAHMKTFLLNAFSLQMVDVPCCVQFEEVDALPDGLTSAIGHADTAAVLGYPMNRCNVHLSEGDVAYIAQLQGGRLPEGSTTLPDGFSFKFIKVSVGRKYANETVSFAKTVLRTTPKQN